jgi:hypothetical protein
MADVLSNPDTKVFFVVRQPVARFISGFNSRLRKGQPRYNNSWSAEETEAFARFPTPDSLAIAVNKPGEQGEAARRAIKSISHVATHLSTWLGSAHDLEQNRSRIAFIGHTPELNRDIPYLTYALGIRGNFTLPTDAIERHETPTGFPTEMSREGAATIHDWYRTDQPILDWCMAFRQRNQICRASP